MIGHYGAMPMATRGYGASPLTWIMAGPAAANPDVAYALALALPQKIVIASTQLARWRSLRASGNKGQRNRAAAQIKKWSTRLAWAQKAYDAKQAHMGAKWDRKEARRNDQESPSLTDLFAPAIEAGTGILETYSQGGVPISPEGGQEYIDPTVYDTGASAGGGMPSWLPYAAAAAAAFLLLGGGAYALSRRK